MLSYGHMEINVVFKFAILIVSIVFHELSHGYTAYFLGDPTAKYEGRLTLNPIKHMELFGSVIVPIITSILAPGIIFGWAKPVPYNPYNLKIKRYGEVIVAAAGPISNLLIAFVFSMYIRSLGFSSLAGALANPVGSISVLIILVNIYLAVFNLIPIPPLDGFKVFWGLLSYRFAHWRAFVERHMFVFLLIFLFTFSLILDPITSLLFRLFTGIHI